MAYILLHKNVYLPQKIINKVESLQKSFEDFVLTQHILKRVAYADRKHAYTDADLIHIIKSSIKNNINTPFEVFTCQNDMTNSWTIIKYCIRVPFINEYDISIVIRPTYDLKTNSYDPKKYIIITAWLNRKKDYHKTLDISRYCSKQDWIKLDAGRK